MAKVNDVKDKLAKLTPLQTLEQSLKTSMANLGEALPRHMKPERVTRIIMTLLKTTPALQECEPISIMAAVFQMAQLGLEAIDGQAYIIPYRIAGVRVAQFQVGYKGLVTLFFRHHLAKSLSSGIVCSNDEFLWDRGQGLLSHKENVRGDRGEAYGYWVKAELTTGGVMIEYMSKAEVEKFAKAKSKTFGSGPWQTDFDQMALKTVLKRLMKILPKSVELQTALQMDETIKTKISPDMTEVNDETPWDNGKVIEVEPVKPEEKKPPEPPTPTVGQVNLDDYATDPKTGKMVHNVTGKPL